LSRRAGAATLGALAALLLGAAAVAPGDPAPATPVARLLTPPIPPGVQAWPQYRGDGSGHTAARDLPLTWSETENVAWKTPLPGRGHSSPIVWGDKIWLTTALEEERSLRLLAYDLASGRQVHDIELFRPAAWQPGHADNSYASPTPATDGERVCAHFGTYGTACVANTDGRVLWKVADQPQEHEVGPGSSPILWGELLIVHCDGTDSQYVLARGKHTGLVVWRRDRHVPADIQPPHRKAFSTPLMIEIGGKPQLVSTGATHSSGYDPATGEELWFFRHEGYSNVPMPILGDGYVVVNSGFSRPHLFALGLGLRGELGADAQRWVYHWQVPANSTPLILGRRLFMVADFGIATWLDLDHLDTVRGDHVWRQRLGARFFASPIAAGDRIYASAMDGKITVLAPGDEFKVLAVNTLEGQIHAIPAFLDGTIVVRTDKALYRLGQKSTKPAP
jgi:outer membrane protein assembly factor BamB